MPALLELQTDFRRALLARDMAAIAPLIAADGLDAAARLAVYRNNVLTSLGDALRDTFPAVCRLVDERFFAYAADEFIRRHPPERACLFEYGAVFPDFLAEFPPCRAFAYLADVARLEWLMNVAAHAADAEALAPAALAGIAAEDTPRLVFCLHPSLGLLASPWPIDRIWRANRAGAQGEETIDLGAGGVRLEVRRAGENVTLRALDGASFAFRHALAAGATLETAVEAALADDPRFDLAAALALLFSDAAITGLALAPAVAETAP